jgi:hypothetical protein
MVKAKTLQVVWHSKEPVYSGEALPKVSASCRSEQPPANVL